MDPKRFLISLCCLTIAASIFADSPDKTESDHKTLKSAGVATDDTGLIDFFRSRTLDDSDRHKIAELIRDLGSDDFAVREKSSSELMKIGSKAAALLNQATNNKDAEVARRVRECLTKIDERQSPAVTMAAARLLAARKPPDTASILLKFAPFAESPAVLDAVRDTLTAVAVRDGKPEVALVEALDSKLPVCRGLAADALVRADQAGPVPAVRKLLDDSDRQVRLRVGMAFVDRKDKSAIPGLIDLVAELPRERSRPIEELLERIALGKSPNVPSGDDEATRKKCRDTWNEWWTKNGDAVDLVKVPAKLVVDMETSLGTIRIELYQQKAPVTVKNFLQYVEDKHYDGLIFHRVIDNFMIQGGGYEPGMKEKQTRDPIKNEAANGLSNERGTLAMARTNVPDSATAQFYINVKDNPFLDKAKTRDQVGYCVFGRVIEGMDVVDKIKAVKTGPSGAFQDVPVEDVVIKSVRLVR